MSPTVPPLKLCTAFVVEAVDEHGHITDGHVEVVSVVPADHAHDPPERIEPGTTLYFVNDLDVTVTPRP